MERRVDVLEPDNVLELAARALSPSVGQFSLTTPYETIAIIGHACVNAVGLELAGGLVEDYSKDASESQSPCLLPEWNSNSIFVFKYARAQSSTRYLLKINKQENNAVLMALALGDDKKTTFDIPVDDYISQRSLPLESNANLPNDLKNLFVSPSRLQDLIDLFKINVIEKLAPGLYKGGYEILSQPLAGREMMEHGAFSQPGRSPFPEGDVPPLASQRPPPGDFAPPGFENEFEINRPPRGFPGGDGARPMNIGDRDLYPPGLGPNDPFRGMMGPGAGAGGGMHPTFDDPMFGGGRGGGYDPQAPPGSRYDPVGPGARPPFGGGRGPSGGGPGGAGGFGGFGGDII